MSDTSPAAAPLPPGWYDDGTGSGLRRWWSGAEWTEHVESPYAAGAAGAAPRPTLPADRPVYGMWIWLIVLMPLLSYVSFFFWQPSFDYLNQISSPGNVGSVYSSMFSSILTPGYFAIAFGSWILYGLTVVFAWRDVVWLRTQGVVRPFHWAWAFLYGIVYIIGRSVIVYRVAKPRGRAPIWVYIAVTVVGFIVVIVWTVTLMSGVISQIPRLPDSAYNS